jgi:hypothetical protein
MKNQILISYNFLPVPTHKDKSIATEPMVATVLSNLAYYGFIPSMDTFEALRGLSDKEIKDFWKTIEPDFKEITGANRNMDNFVVYKNFPKEVLDMTSSRYWFNQIMMYWGAPNELFTEEVQPRESLKEKTSLKVLSLSDNDTLSHIWQQIKQLPMRWNDNQTKHAQYLSQVLPSQTIMLDEFSFKENGINTIVNVRKNNPHLSFEIKDATDVLRLAAGLSEGDVALRENVKFKKFARPLRRQLLVMLENSNNLEEDLSSRQDTWKRLLANLHPGDYKLPRVQQAYDSLYQNKLKSFSARVENAVVKKDENTLEMLKSRPGDFLRRLHKMYGTFGTKAVKAFVEVVPQLDTIQLLKLDNYLLTINDRKSLIYPPKGNWTKAQVAQNNKVAFTFEDKHLLREAIDGEIKSRLDREFPQGVNLDLNTDKIKLQTNDQKLASYGRGTEFDIPEKMQFIRTASYWENKSHGNTWFDNGWNFFDNSWNPMGTCCWNSHQFSDSAIFSGDPTNSKDLKGRACQMIDLYLDKLEQQGVTYAVWNILCYSHISFANAQEVLATLQWGEEAQKGNLYEPARAQMVFPVEGDNLTKYIAYIDIPNRKLVYMDANFYGHVQSATENLGILSEKMPAYVEYLKSLPSVADLFSHATEGEMPVLYYDDKQAIAQGTQAYVFKPVNTSNDFEQVNLAKVLASGNETLNDKKKMKKMI